MSERKGSPIGRGRFAYDETRFKPNQKQAAALLVEYENTPYKERQTLEEIAEEVGVTRRTLHNWNTKDQNFIAYKNSIAADYLDTQLAFVYAKLLDGIGNGSMKGIELFMRRFGDLDSRSEVTIRDNGGEQTQEERLEALKERLGEAEK